MKLACHCIIYIIIIISIPNLIYSQDILNINNDSKKSISVEPLYIIKPTANKISSTDYSIINKILKAICSSTQFDEKIPQPGCGSIAKILITNNDNSINEIYIVHIHNTSNILLRNKNGDLYSLDANNSKELLSLLDSIGYITKNLLAVNENQ